MTTAPTDDYPARFSVDYQERHDRLTALFRIFLVIPIAIVLGLLQSASFAAGERGASAGLSTTAGISVATALMILFRQRYPHWWFDFQREFARLGARAGAYVMLLRDEYPSTEDQQAVHLDLDYPEAAQLNRWLPLVKWFLAIPHYVVLFVLAVGLFFAIVFAWFAILATGRMPRGVFDYAVGVSRWGLRVQAYAFFMLTDRYPPFSLR